MALIFEKKRESITFTIMLLLILAVTGIPYLNGGGAAGVTPALSITAMGVCTTYFSFRYICKEWTLSLAGTFLFMLSQFYLADLSGKGDLGECLAFIFVPVLFAGLYDVLQYSGKKVYLIAIAFVGLIVSNTGMALLGVLIVFGCLGAALLFKECRRRAYNNEKLHKLYIVAFTVTCSIIFIVLRNISGENSGEVQGILIGNQTQSLASFFNVRGEFAQGICNVGIGIPVLTLLCSRFLFGALKNKWGDIFFYAGILMLFATTDFFPWKWFNGTFLNMIQYTYRLYPYILCSIILGILLVLAEKCMERADRILVFISAISLFFAVWQNWP